MKPHGTGGFILAEAVLAVAIVSVSLLVIMQGLVAGFRTGIIFQDKAKAVLLASDRLEEVAHDPSKTWGPREPAQPPWQRFTYTMRITPFNERLNTVALGVQWLSGAKGRTVGAKIIVFNNDRAQSKTYIP